MPQSTGEEWQDWGDEWQEEDEPPVFNLWTKQNLIVIFIGMALAIDYTVVLVSLPNYWTNVAPTKSAWLGLVVGMYDLSQFLFAPIFGLLSDHHGIKKSFVLALVVNITGNIIYSLGIVVGGYRGIDSSMQPIWGTYSLLIVGRFVAGIGSAALGLSAVYFTRTTSVADRQRAMAAQQAPLVFARAVGPSVGTILTMFMPQHLEGNDKLQQLFNFLTVPGWLCVGVSALALLVTASSFHEPAVFKQQRTQQQEDKRRHQRFDLRQAPGLVRLVATICPVYLLMTVVRMGLIGAMVYLAVGQYHLVPSSFYLWLPWMGILGGSIVGAQILKWCVDRGVSDVGMSVHSQWPLVAGVLLLLDIRRLPNSLQFGYGGHSPPPQRAPTWCFFAGSALIAVSNMLYSPSHETVYTRRLSALEDEAQGRIGLFTALFTATGAFSRFLGPFVGVYILTVAPVDDTSGRPASRDATQYLSSCPGPPPSHPDDLSQPAVQQWMRQCMLDYPTGFGNKGGEYLRDLPRPEPCAPPSVSSPLQSSVSLHWMTVSAASSNATVPSESHDGIGNNVSHSSSSSKWAMANGSRINGSVIYSGSTRSASVVTGRNGNGTGKLCDYCPVTTCCAAIGAAFKADNYNLVEELMKEKCCDATTKCLDLRDFCYPFVFPQHFYNDGCLVTNVNIFMPVVAALTVATAVFMCWLDRNHRGTVRSRSRSSVAARALSTGRVLDGMVGGTRMLPADGGKASKRKRQDDRTRPLMDFVAKEESTV